MSSVVIIRSARCVENIDFSFNGSRMHTHTHTHYLQIFGRRLGNHSILCFFAMFIILVWQKKVRERRFSCKADGIHRVCHIDHTYTGLNK